MSVKQITLVHVDWFSLKIYHATSPSSFTFTPDMYIVCPFKYANGFVVILFYIFKKFSVDLSTWCFLSHRRDSDSLKFSCVCSDSVSWSVLVHACDLSARMYRVTIGHNRLHWDNFPMKYTKPLWEILALSNETKMQICSNHRDNSCDIPHNL